MSVAFYFDVHVRRAVTEGLRLREVDVLTAQKDSAATMDDPALLDRAMALGLASYSLWGKQLAWVKIVTPSSSSISRQR